MFSLALINIAGSFNSLIINKIPNFGHLVNMDDYKEKKDYLRSQIPICSVLGISGTVPE